ncbi:hypothetical protein OUZ56_024734 [Daphnia magna]|uniref:Uncharacterized protein n=1 Tax=Daphnia magna TaxID=35525 RepID=A0ABQ9ZHU7_9CRUS|nr:hypothetical protein OUZ56_024734 [Daphnia magna]
MASVMTADNAVALRVDSANRRRPGTTSTSGGGRTKLLPTITGVGAATERQGENAVPSLSCSTAVVSHHSSQRLHFLTHCGTGWAGCLRDQVRQCWTMFTKRKKGSHFRFLSRVCPEAAVADFRTLQPQHHPSLSCLSPLLELRLRDEPNMCEDPLLWFVR